MTTERRQTRLTSVDILLYIAKPKSEFSNLKSLSPVRVLARIWFLTSEEEQCLLAQCGAQRKPLVITALHTGFRRSELLSPTWQDVDSQRQMITVQAAYAKNGESRSVPMNDVLLSTLKVCKIKHPPEEPVFWTQRGTPYRFYRSAFERAVRKAGIEDFTFYDLRHTFASRLVMAGINLPTGQN